MCANNHAQKSHKAVKDGVYKKKKKKKVLIYLIVAVYTIVCVHLSLRYSEHVAGVFSNQPTNIPSPMTMFPVPSEVCKQIMCRTKLFKSPGKVGSHFTTMPLLPKLFLSPGDITSEKLIHILLSYVSLSKFFSVQAPSPQKSWLTFYNYALQE